MIQTNKCLMSMLINILLSISLAAAALLIGLQGFKTPGYYTVYNNVVNRLCWRPEHDMIK